MPARITAIEPQQKNPQRVNIYLDGEFAFGLAKIVAAWLKVGQELDEAGIARLQAEDERETAYQKALHFLSYRPRSSAEVRRNLTRRGLAPALVEATIARLQENGLLDDEQFARLWVENRSAFRPRSQAALKMELRQKGLDEQAIQSALEAEANDEEQLARLAARKQARRYAGLEWPEFRRKLGGFLARRGFSYTVLAPVLSEIWRETHPMAETGDTLDNEE
ncbi:MAG: RecX family transcriptional regulator [Anaerolineales bacterium]